MVIVTGVRQTHLYALNHSEGDNSFLKEGQEKESFNPTNFHSKVSFLFSYAGAKPPYF